MTKHKHKVHSFLDYIVESLGEFLKTLIPRLPPRFLGSGSLGQLWKGEEGDPGIVLPKVPRWFLCAASVYRQSSSHSFKNQFTELFICYVIRSLTPSLQCTCTVPSFPESPPLNAPTQGLPLQSPSLNMSFLHHTTLPCMCLPAFSWWAFWNVLPLFFPSSDAITIILPLSSAEVSLDITHFGNQPRSTHWLSSSIPP